MEGWPPRLLVFSSPGLSQPGSVMASLHLFLQPKVQKLEVSMRLASVP